MQVKEIVVIGPPGSGKDTQVEELSKYNKFQIISSGDIVRELSRTNEKVKKVMDQGGLIDDEVLLAEVDKKLGDIGDMEGIVFDGFPRTLRQAEKLPEILLHHDRNLDIVIYLSLEEEEIVKRLSGRMVCSICGHNIGSHRDKCGDCGGQPERRHDDEPAVIISRVQTFLENTLPLIGYYRNKGILLEVDGNQSISEVARDIKAKLTNV